MRRRRSEREQPRVFSRSLAILFANRELSTGYDVIAAWKSHATRRSR